ncbi:MAG TPA: low-specificity L-threonine aldolase [Herpetosiphonaceae bacterium]
MIDIRSDTVTKPSPAMREAMARAEVGDDVFGNDPTINRLQELAAAAVGKEAALFVASGTMGNLTALLAHCGRGQELLVGDESHIYHYEAGGASALGGLVYHLLPTDAQGQLPLDAVRAAVRPAYDSHAAPAGVICVESSHNRRGGVVPSLAYLAELRGVADELGLPVHMDGARLFNAAVALGVPAKAIADHVSTVQFCLSKGLGAPVGSIVAGPREWISRVHRLRKMVGGGMRQAGVLAAAGIIALTESPGRLAEDHANARLLAEGLAALPGVEIDLAAVQTNIVVFRLRDGLMAPEAFLAALRERGVLMVGFGGDRIRAVTHVDVSAAQLREALEIVTSVLQNAKGVV